MAAAAAAPIAAAAHAVAHPHWHVQTAEERVSRDTFLLPRGAVYTGILPAASVGQPPRIERFGVQIEVAGAQRRRLALNPHVESKIYDAFHSARMDSGDVHATLFKQHPSVLNHPVAFSHAHVGYALPIQGINVLFTPERTEMFFDATTGADVPTTTDICHSDVHDACVLVGIGASAIATVERWGDEQRNAPRILSKGTYESTVFKWDEMAESHARARALSAKRFHELDRLVIDHAVHIDPEWTRVREMFSLVEHLLVLHQDAMAAPDSRLFVVLVNAANRGTCVLLSIVLTLLSRTYHATKGGPGGRGIAPTHTIGDVMVVVNGFWRAMHIGTAVKHTDCTALESNTLLALELNMRSMLNRNHSSYDIEPKAKHKRCLADKQCFCQMSLLYVEWHRMFWPSEPVHLPIRQVDVDLTGDDDADEEIRVKVEEIHLDHAAPAMEEEQDFARFDTSLPDLPSPGFPPYEHHAAVYADMLLVSPIGEPVPVEAPAEPAAAAPAAAAEQIKRKETPVPVDEEGGLLSPTSSKKQRTMLGELAPIVFEVRSARAAYKAKKYEFEQAAADLEARRQALAAAEETKHTLEAAWQAAELRIHAAQEEAKALGITFTIQDE